MKITSFSDNVIPHWENPEIIYNKEFKWWPSDTEERYDPIDNLYGPHDIIYKINKNGFRCEEFDILSSKRIIFLGCSHTFGVGLPLEHSWPHILLELIKKETGYSIPFWNLSLSGVGLDTLVRMFYQYGLKLKPQLIFALFPEYRRELYRNYSNHLTQHTVNGTDNFNNIPYLLDHRIVHYETDKNLCFLDYMIKSINSKLIHNNWCVTPDPMYKKFQISHDINLSFNKRARDKIHSGYEAHFDFAQKIFEQHKDIILESLKD